MAEFVVYRSEDGVIDSIPADQQLSFAPKFWMVVEARNPAEAGMIFAQAMIPKKSIEAVLLALMNAIDWEIDSDFDDCTEYDVMQVDRILDKSIFADLDRVQDAGSSVVRFEAKS